MVKHVFKYTLCGKPYQWFTVNEQKAESVKRTMENTGMHFKYLKIEMVPRSIHDKPVTVS